MRRIKASATVRELAASYLCNKFRSAYGANYRDNFQRIAAAAFGRPIAPFSVGLKEASALPSWRIKKFASAVIAEESEYLPGSYYLDRHPALLPLRKCT